MRATAAHPQARFFEVLDASGKMLERIMAFDTAEGWVDQCAIDARGHFLGDGQGNLKIDRIYPEGGIILRIKPI